VRATRRVLALSGFAIHYGPCILDQNDPEASMPANDADEMSIGVTAFKARCLALIDDVARGKTRRVLLMKHNRPVAAIVPVESSPVELWGALRGTVKVAPGTDLTKGTGEVWEADT
jgi:antitoxin (DNA-binding transcriptional repressor) of toxin-antitoxin stability system